MPVRPLAELAAGSRVLIDANIIIYAANRASRQCADFLNRCAREDVRGITTFEVLAEVCHRLMIEDALAAGYIDKATASQLRRRRHVVSALKNYWPVLARLLESNLLPLDLDQPRFLRAQIMCERYQLLTNDSLVLAAADSYKISNLATRDNDFDRIPWLTVYKPEDIA